jgi:RecA-family ATPase
VAFIKQYSVQDLIKLKETKEILINNWLHRGDLLFVKAQKKVGKSIFVQALAHCASTGVPFLGEYEVTKPLKVAYLFSEGALVDWKERVINMSKMFPACNDNLKFFQCNFLKMHTEEDREELLQALVKSGIKYDVIVWDCLYKFLFGTDTNNSVSIGMFNANEEYIRNYFNAASVMVHHDSEKMYRDQKGNAHSAASATNAMGSTFILANVTQVYTIQKFKDENKLPFNKIVLGDKRSGDLVTELIYYNVVPEDNDEEVLGIELDRREADSNYNTVKYYIKEHGKVKVRGLIKAIGLTCSYETLRRIVNKLIKEKLVSRSRYNAIEHFMWIGG